MVNTVVLSGQVDSTYQQGVSLQHLLREDIDMARKGGKRSRSAITGRFVKWVTARKNPKTTVTESTKKSKK
ncbi:hypothetical protein [Nakamurella endophytica]|uniref:Uncharacterized protein n=1 Tax=Nakamurella endophytica TaxID=1748367 RepID=A0A917TB11_9ACTN|nr:hypothetical protein [Nakamurella endophytica]GGM15706.1 hypothetical protein GCM10011594_39680 [Nakamurella endophytica]